MALPAHEGGLAASRVGREADHHRLPIRSLAHHHGPAASVAALGHGAAPQARNLAAAGDALAVERRGELQGPGSAGGLGGGAQTWRGGGRGRMRGGARHGCHRGRGEVQGAIVEGWGWRNSRWGNGGEGRWGGDGASDG